MVYRVPYFAHVSGMPDDPNTEMGFEQGITPITGVSEDPQVLELRRLLSETLPLPCGISAEGENEFAWVRSTKTGVEIRIPSKWWRNLGETILGKITWAEGSGKRVAQFSLPEMKQIVRTAGAVDRNGALPVYSDKLVASRWRGIQRPR